MVASVTQECILENYPVCGKCVWSREIVTASDKGEFFFTIGCCMEGMKRGQTFKCPLMNKEVRDSAEFRHQYLTLMTETHDGWYLSR